MVAVVTLVVGGATLVAGGLLGRWLERRSVKKAKAIHKPKAMDPKAYDERWNFVVASYQHGQDQYDRLIPWGSGGALLLSVGLLENLIKHPLPGTTWALAGGWAGLFAALASSVCGHWFSARMYEADKNAMDLAQKGSLSDDEKVEHWRLTRTTATMDRWTRALNWISLIGFLGGAALVILFAFLNLG